MGVCYLPQFPFGPWQRFTYDDLTLTLDFTKQRPIGQGGNLLEQWGYDRYLDPEYLVNPQINYAGYTQTDGPPHAAPHLFEWRLTSLSLEEFQLLNAIWRRSLKDKQPVRLDDARYVVSEPSPRVRGRVFPTIDYTLPTIAGMVYYFGRFDIWLKLGREQEVWPRVYSLQMSAVEYSPQTPVLEDVV